MSSPVHQAGIAYDPSRVRNRYHQGLVTDAASAAAAIGDGDTVAISGFASAGTPEAFARALAERTLAEVDGIALRMPYQSEPTARRKINAGEVDDVDVHLSHIARTEHDVQVIDTEHGLADLRSLSPRKRSRLNVDRCADPSFSSAAARLPRSRRGTARFREHTAYPRGGVLVPHPLRGDREHAAVRPAPDRKDPEDS